MTRMRPPGTSPSDALHPTLVQWLALAPLLVGASRVPAALVLALAVPAVVVTGHALAAMAARAVPGPARLPVGLLASGAVIGVAVLGLRAAWPGLGDAPYLLLPLALACALPFSAGGVDGSVDPSPRDALLLGVRFALLVAATAVARWALEPALPLMGRPAGAMILAGLVLAAAQWFDGRGASPAERGS